MDNNIWYRVRSQLFLMNNHSMKTVLAFAEHKVLITSAVSPSRLSTAVRTPNLSSAASGKVSQPNLQGSMQLHAACLPSPSATR